MYGLCPTVLADLGAGSGLKDAMILALHEQNKLSDMFVGYLLGRNIRYEAD